MYYVISWSPINSEQRYLVTQNWQSNIQVQVEIPNIESIAAELLQWYFVVFYFLWAPMDLSSTSDIRIAESLEVARTKSRSTNVLWIYLM